MSTDNVDKVGGGHIMCAMVGHCGKINSLENNRYESETQSYDLLALLSSFT